MTNPTSNFGWQMPTSTDLVTDLPADFETFGQAVDTSLADLKGGTTGQVLSKASGTDMDFTWVTSDDANAIQNAIVDAKGDLIAASAADTPARLAVGSNGETLVADSSATTGLRWQGNFAAGKNKIINGDFGIWQRGTSLSLTTNAGAFLADRFLINWSGTFTGTISQQTFTPGTAPVAGYEGQFFNRIVRTGTTSVAPTFYQRVENVRTFAGQTVTFSFWAKADAARSVGIQAYQSFGTGGSAATDNNAGTASLTTSWQRFSFTYTMPSVSGKTISTSNDSWMTFYWNLPDSTAFTIDTWGWQMEAGSVATAFQTATGTIQGEFDACTWYYDKRGGQAGTGTILNNALSNSAGTNAAFSFPIKMRVAPTAVEYASLRLSDTSSGFTVSSVTLTNCTPTTANVNVATTGMTAFRSCYLDASATGNYIAFSAEL